MKLLYSCAQFLISEWVWSFTFALYHPIINVLIMLFLFFYFAQQRVIPSVLQVICSQLWAILWFIVFVHIILDSFLGISFSDESSSVMIHPLASCFLLGMIYAALQMTFFYILSFFNHIPLRRFAQLICLSNTVSALIVFKFLPD